MSKYNLTKIGLIFFIMALLLSVIAGILNFLIPEILIVNAVIGGLGGIFFLIALILMGIGGIGFKEYGKKHKKFVLIAIIFFIASIVFAMIIGFYTSFAIFSSMSESLSDSGDVLNSLSPLKNIFIITPISAVFSGLVYVFLLHELEDKYGKFILYGAFVLLIISSGIIAWQGTQVFDEWILDIKPIVENINTSAPTITSYNEMQTISTELQKEISSVSIWGVFPNILFLITSIIPLNRINSGRLKRKIPRSNEKMYEAGYKQIKTQEYIRCPNCGGQNSINSEFCTNCGKKLK